MDYSLHVITDSRLEMTRITETVEQSQLRIISTVKSRCDGIVGEMRNLKEDYTTHICAIPERNGYYKGVRDLGVGDFQLIKTIPSLACCCTCACGAIQMSSHTCQASYQDGYCIVENSNKTKFIRKYQLQPSINDEKDVMKQLHNDINIFTTLKHENFAQVFGVCRLSNYPAIIFHDVKRTLVKEYLDSIPKKDFVSFYIQFIHERESILNHLRTYYPPDTMSWDNYPKPNSTYINEHNRLIVASISHRYNLGGYWYPVIDPSSSVEFEISKTRQAPSLTSLTWMTQSCLEKPHILSVYTMIYDYCITWNGFEVGQCYAPGSILTCGGKTLVGRARDSLGTWIVTWETWPDTNGSCHSYYIYNRGSITVDSDSAEDGTVLLLHAGIMCYYLQIFPASSLAYSWIAQAFQLDSSLHSRDYVVDDDLYMIDGYWYLHIEPKHRHTQDFFPLYDTFMADDPHILSLLIHPPLVDNQTNKMSFPVLSWLYSADTEMSLEEVKEVFNVEINISWQSLEPLQSSRLTAVPELNAEYGFDPTQGGIDVCECYELPILELFSAPQFMPESMMSGTEEPMSIISDGAQWALHDKGGSPQESIMKDTIKGIKRVHNDKVPTEAQITTVLEHSIHTRYQDLFIMVFTFIATLLLSFFVQSYL
ncbi:hypothetical protein EDD85DRAFT_447848 [Armillaria nabsnona]|nr:hypothetical protein EDD85DRAFT_447848 [Armillaria nabsnona]